MGQYYKPILLEVTNGEYTPIQWVYSHRVKSTYKRDDGSKFRVGSGLKLTEHSWLNNSFVNSVENLLVEGGPWYKKPIVWAGDYGKKELAGESLYSMATNDKELITNKRRILKRVRYIVNHTQKTFVDKQKVPGIDGWYLHPLPLLTCEGNGQGGGDYFGEDPNNLVGSWARDVISIEEKIPEGYTEIFFNLTEEV